MGLSKDLTWTKCPGREEQSTSYVQAMTLVMRLAPAPRTLTNHHCLASRDDYSKAVHDQRAGQGAR
jgi:hypothetical protein